MRRGAALGYLGTLLALPLAGCQGQLCFSLPPSSGSAATPTLFGSQIYAVDDVDKAIAAIAGCGGTRVRIGTSDGFDFSDAVFETAAKHGIRVVAVTPVAPQPIDPGPYAAKCATLQLRYAKYAPVWEIWNEPNLAQYWGAPPNADAYADVAIPAAKALVAAGAGHVWSGGTSGIDLGWIGRLVARGAYQVMNGCAVHSYVAPCAAYGTYADLRGILPGRVSIHTTETCVPSSDDQTSFIRQMWYLHRILGIGTMIWCELRDGSAGTNGAYAYDYGLLYSDYSPKPSYQAIAALLATPAG